MTQYLNDSIFWIEVEKIQPNPYQPRRDFNPDALQGLSDSIRQYGVLQPLVVTRKEEAKEDGGLRVSYELIAGERRWRAAKLGGIVQVPAVIRAGEEDPRAKLELAIIENLQREDLNAVDRAHAFQRLVDEFGFKHGEVGRKVGRSREYVSNTLRLLSLPETMLDAVRVGKISEGHARTMMMLSDRPDEQKVLFKEIVYKKLSVREAESIAREVAQDRVRKKKHKPDPELAAIEGKLSNTLGTRVHIKRKENGGKLVIDFFSNTDLEDILKLMESNEKRGMSAFMDRFIDSQNKNEEEKKEVTTLEGDVPAVERVENTRSDDSRASMAVPENDLRFAEKEGRQEEENKEVVGSAEGEHERTLARETEHTPQNTENSVRESNHERINAPFTNDRHELPEDMPNEGGGANEVREPKPAEENASDTFSQELLSGDTETQHTSEPVSREEVTSSEEHRDAREPSGEEAEGHSTRPDEPNTVAHADDQGQSENEDENLYSVKNFTI